MQRFNQCRHGRCSKDAPTRYIRNVEDQQTSDRYNRASHRLRTFRWYRQCVLGLIRGRSSRGSTLCQGCMFACLVVCVANGVRFGVPSSNPSPQVPHVTSMLAKFECLSPLLRRFYVIESGIRTSRCKVEHKVRSIP